MEPRPRPRHHLPLTILSVLLAAASIAWPMIGLPAVAVAVLVFIVTHAPLRLVVGLIAGPLALAGFARFMLIYATPNIVGSGQRGAETKAVYRLREIYWAQQQVRSLDVLEPGARYAPMSVLVGESEVATLLRPSAYKRVGDGPAVYRAEGYYFVTYPQGDQWTGYAWPADGTPGGGRRVYFIDQDERICEALNEDLRYLGLERLPAQDAGRTRTPDAGPCGVGADGSDWTAWKNKRPRTEARR